MRILNASKWQEPIIHTALDDLESFLWVLIWGIVYASKDIQGARDHNLGIKLMLEAWEGDNRLKRSAIGSWKDAVFKGLIMEWLGIFDRAIKETEQIVNLLPSIPLGSPTWNQACDWLESYCIRIYGDVLKSGFSHLERVSNYPDWEAVVAANVQPQDQTPVQTLAMLLSR